MLCRSTVLLGDSQLFHCTKKCDNAPTTKSCALSQTQSDVPVYLPANLWIPITVYMVLYLLVSHKICVNFVFYSL